MDVAPTRDLMHAGRQRSTETRVSLENWGEVNEPAGRVTEAHLPRDRAVHRLRNHERTRRPEPEPGLQPMP